MKVLLPLHRDKGSSKESKYKDNQEHCDFPNTVKWDRFSLQFLLLSGRKRNTGSALLSSLSPVLVTVTLFVFLQLHYSRIKE